MSGELLDIQGGLTTPGTLSSIIPGRDGLEGTYADIQQSDSVSAVLVSAGTYSIERISPVPIPSGAWLLGSGLIGFFIWRRQS